MRRAQDRARSARSRKNGARSATIESRALSALKLARDENVPAKRADFFKLEICKSLNVRFIRLIFYGQLLLKDYCINLFQILTFHSYSYMPFP